MMRLLPPRHDLRVESEEGQAFFRLHAALLALLAFETVSVAMPGLVGSFEVVCVLTYVCYAYLWAWVVVCRVGSDVPRQWSALLLDHIVFGLCFGLAGRAGASLAWVAVTTSVGHGMRFGERRGVAAALIGGLAIFSATTFGADWNLPLSIALGLAASAIISPIYVTRLAHAIETQRRDAEARAATLEQAVRTDALTGLLSRSGFIAAWNALSDASGMSQVAVGLVYIDLDGFKAVNDTRGHEVGDEVLRQIAKQLVMAVRNTDVVARFGGDEFVILVRSPMCLADVQEVASKAVASVQHWSALFSPDPKPGASAGTIYSPPGVTLAEALRKADERMFEVKRERKSLQATSNLGAAR